MLALKMAPKSKNKSENIGLQDACAADVHFDSVFQAKPTPEKSANW